jgi:DNA-binding SARP family transcriptional activator
MYAMPVLHIHLLGDFRLTYGDALVTTFVQARLQALLAYLLLHAGSPQPRQRLAFLFWPDAPEPQARTNLRQLLHTLRWSLPAADHHLQIENNTVQWRQGAAYTLDIDAFENELSLAAAAAKEGQSALERTALETAVEHYRGDLLADSYETWILPERERLSQAYFRALERLVLLAEEQRDYPAAISFAERLLRHDPVHETTYRRLMRLHALQGDRTRALQAYHACISVLEHELGVGPDPDTQEAYQRLLHMETPTVLQAQGTSLARIQPVLVGRNREWEVLRTTWRRTASYHTSLVLISGEAGLGKTRLAEEFLEWDARQGITTARTRAYTVEGQLAYTPVTELLRSSPMSTRLSRLEAVWLVELARLLPELLIEWPDLPKPEPLSDCSQHQRLFEALARAVTNNQAPLLLLFDDMQWCDRNTLEWLHYLLHYAAKARMLLLCAVRPEEVEETHPLNQLLVDLRMHEQVTEIELEPLDSKHTTALGERLAGRKLDGLEATRLYRYTEGNPLFIVETVRAEMAGGVAGSDSKRLASAKLKLPAYPFRLPAKIQAVIQARLRQLSPPAHDLAGIAAIIGREFTFDDLARASGSDDETLVQGLDELWRRRIVRVQGKNTYIFSHARIREAAYAEISPARRQALQRRVAAALKEI